MGGPVPEMVVAMEPEQLLWLLQLLLLLLAAQTLSMGSAMVQVSFV